MATASKSTASKSTALVNIQAELAKQAEEMSKRIAAPSGDIIRVTQDKNFVLPTGEKSPGPLSVVIIDFVSANYFYDRPFSKEEQTPPACFALGSEPTSLSPDKSSPLLQSKESCAKCPNNVFGSNGKGKACANTRLLAVTVPAKDGEDMPIYVLKVSPTGIKAFDSYVSALASKKQVPIQAITQIYFDPALTYGSLRFGNPETNPALERCFGMQAEARKRLMTPPDVSTWEPVQVKGRGKR